MIASILDLAWNAGQSCLPRQANTQNVAGSALTGQGCGDICWGSWWQWRKTDRLVHEKLL
jgi:hypothetical protein